MYRLFKKWNSIRGYKKECKKILYKFENVEECDQWLMSYKCVLKDVA